MKDIAIRTLRWFLRLYYYRVQLLTGATIAGLSLLARSDSAPGKMVRGVFDIDTWFSLAFTGLLCILLALGMRLSARLVRIYGPERFEFAAKGLEPVGKGTPAFIRDAGWSLLGILPLILVVMHRHAESGLFGENGGVGGFAAGCIVTGGAVVALLLYAVAVLMAVVVLGKDKMEPLTGLNLLPRGLLDRTAGLHQALEQKITSARAAGAAGQHPGASFLTAAGSLWRMVGWLLRCLPKKFQPGIIGPDNEPLPGHLVLAAFTVFSAALVAVVGGASPYSVAPLVSLLSLLLAACLVLGGLAFFLDRIPLPLSLVVGVWALGVSSIWENPHGIPRVDAPGSAPLPASEVLGVDPNDPADGFPVIIAAEGGGIHAGMWAAHVLEQLAQDTGMGVTGADGTRAKAGKAFLSRVRCVSGVSGGSYGLMYFVNTMANGNPGLDESGRLTAEAGSSSLGAVVHGLVFSDLLSSFLPVGRDQDRGQTMEQAWLRHTRGLEGVRLSDWIPAVRERRCPAVLFNATSVERGTPLVFGNTSFDSAPVPVKEWLYAPNGGYSVAAVSAARASASFPYVTPAARVTNEGREEHAVDGGYYDNYGMAVLTRWLSGGLDKLCTSPMQNRRCPERVLVIQIRSAGTPVPEGTTWDEDPRVNPGMLPPPMEESILSELQAPLATLMSVRSSGQRQHNEDDFARLCEIWGNPNRELRPVKEVLPQLLGQPAPGYGKVVIHNAVFTFRGNPPLSWHLTEKEKQDVTSVRLADRHPANLQAVRDYIAAAVAVEESKKSEKQR